MPEANVRLAAQEECEKLFLEPEFHEQLLKLLRIAFVSGAVWQAQQQLNKAKEAADARS